MRTAPQFFATVVELVFVRFGEHTTPVEAIRATNGLLALSALVAIVAPLNY